MKSYNTQSFKYIALDRNLQPIRDISAYVEDGGTVEYNSLTRLKANCTITVSLSSEEVLNLYAIRIYNCLNDLEECLGTFIISTPDHKFEEDLQTIECVGYSTLWLISNNSPSSRYYVGKGTNCIAEVKRILTMLGFSFSIADCDKTTSTNREWQLGSYYLDIINDLLDTAGYTSLYVDVLGSYKSAPYVLPEDREIDLILNKNDIDSMIEPTQISTLDKFNVYNKFILYVNNPELDLYAVYERTDGDTGTNNAPVNTYVEELQDISDYDTLYGKCKQKSADSVSIYNKVQISIATRMIPTYLATISLRHYQSRGKYSCTSFSIPLEVGGSMDISLRRLVSI